MVLVIRSDRHARDRDEPTRRRTVGDRVSTRTSQIERPDALACRGALVQVELKGRLRPHLDCGATRLAVTLREMHIAHTEETTGGRDRDIDRGAGVQLLDVDVARDLTRWDRAQGVSGDERITRHCPNRIGWHREPAACHQGGLALGNPFAQCTTRGQTDHPRMREVGNAHSRQVTGFGEPVSDRPSHQMRIREVIGKEPEPRNLHGVAKRRRNDIDDAHFKEVALLGIVDCNRTRERMHRSEIDFGNLIKG